MSLLQHRIEISHTESFNERLACVVNITSPPPYSIPSFSFSFHELVICPRRCMEQLEEELMRMQPLMNPTTIEFLVDRIVKYAARLARRRCQVVIPVGHVVEARLDIVHLRLEDVEKGVYRGGSRDEVISCPVCLEDLILGMEFCKLPCSHMFHASCIERWCETSRSCPCCRHKLEYENEEQLAVGFNLSLVLIFCIINICFIFWIINICQSKQLL